MSVADDDNRSQTEEQDPSGGTFQSGKWYGNSASGSIAPASVLEQVIPILQSEKSISYCKQLQNATGHDRSHQPMHDVMHFDGTQLATNQHVSSNGTKAARDAVGDDLEPSAADNLKSLVQECGVSPHKISELLQELPPLRSSDVLIDYYFRSVWVSALMSSSPIETNSSSHSNWTRYPVSEQDFRTAYISVCAHGRDGIGATNPNDVRFLPLLFVVLAIAVRLAPEHIAGDARHRRVTSLRYYWSCEPVIGLVMRP